MVDADGPSSEGSMLEDLSRKLDSVLALLEASAPKAHSVAEVERFWALDGLRQRVEQQAGAVLFTGTVQLPTGEPYAWQQSATTDQLLSLDWSELNDTIAALAHPMRLLLLQQVAQGKRSTAELSAINTLGTTGQLYHHIRPLLAAGWLRKGSRGHYEIPGPRVVPLLIILAAAQR
jgi:hypothetical protein